MTASNPRYLSFVDLLLVILMAWEYVFSVFLRTSAQGYVTTVGPVEFRGSELRGTRLPVETFIAFWRTENGITLGS
jgi:hypothetical protein